MYSVLRVLDPLNPQALVAIGESMNVVRPGSFTGLRRRGDGFSVDLSREDDWSIHSTAIEAALASLDAPLRAAGARGAKVMIDVAVDGDDRGERVWVSVWCGPDLAARLADLRITFMVTMY